MFWTLELASYLEDAPWPATKDELIDFAIRSGAPLEVVENLQELEEEVFFGWIIRPNFFNAFIGLPIIF